MHKWPKNVTDNEDSEEEIAAKKGKGGRVGKKAKETKKRGKKTRFIPNAPCPTLLVVTHCTGKQVPTKHERRQL